MRELIAALRAGEVPEPSRGPAMRSFRQASRVLAGLEPRGRARGGGMSPDFERRLTAHWDEPEAVRPGRLRGQRGGYDGLRQALAMSGPT